jgi:Flp pilus assembly protein TadG
MHHFLARRPTERGQALVEFALVVPIFILLLVGLFDLGRGVYMFNTISNAAREAVRLGIVDQYVGTATPPVAGIKGRAAQHAVSVGVSNGDVTVCILNADLSNPDGSQTYQTQADCGPTPGGTDPFCMRDPQNNYGAAYGCVVQVTVRARFTAATPMIGALIGTINMSSTSNEPIEARNDSCVSPNCP